MKLKHCGPFLSPIRHTAGLAGDIRLPEPAQEREKPWPASLLAVPPLPSPFVLGQISAFCASSVGTTCATLMQRRLLVDDRTSGESLGSSAVTTAISTKALEGTERKVIGF